MLITQKRLLLASLLLLSSGYTLPAALGGFEEYGEVYIPQKIHSPWEELSPVGRQYLQRTFEALGQAVDKAKKNKKKNSIQDELMAIQSETNKFLSAYANDDNYRETVIRLFNEVLDIGLDDRAHAIALHIGQRKKASLADQELSRRLIEQIDRGEQYVDHLDSDDDAEFRSHKARIKTEVDKIKKDPRYKQEMNEQQGAQFYNHMPAINVYDGYFDERINN